jgi:hypothetical protein
MGSRAFLGEAFVLGLLALFFATVLGEDFVVFDGSLFLFVAELLDLLLLPLLCSCFFLVVGWWGLGEALGLLDTPRLLATGILAGSLQKREFWVCVLSKYT